MKKAKIIIIAVLSVLCIFCITMFGCARAGGDTPTPTPTPPGPSPEPPTPTGVVLVGENGDMFTDKEVVAETQSSFDCHDYLYYRGSDGRRYIASYSITEKNGTPYNNQIKFQFIVEDGDGYYLYLNVKTSDNVSHSRRVYIRPGHTTPPVIKIADFDTLIGMVGTTYNVPEITVTDPFGTPVTKTVTAYYKASATSTEESVSITANKFTATKQGYYGIRVVATNGYNISATATKELFVKNSVDVGFIEDFAYEASKVNSVNQELNYTSVAPVWYETFNGRNGVVSSNTGYQTYPDMAFRSSFSASALESYTNWDYISIWIWIDREGSYDLYNNNTLYTSVHGRTWSELKLTRDIINASDWYIKPKQEGETTLQSFYRLLTTTGINLFWGWLGDNTTVYVDEIRYVKQATVTLPETTGKVGQQVTLNATTSAGSSKFTYTVTDPSGNYVALTDGNKFTPAVAGNYRYVVKLDDSVYGGSCTGVITVSSDYEIVYTKPSPYVNEGQVYTVPTATLQKNGATVAGVTPTVAVTLGGQTVAVSNNQFTVITTGTYTVTYTANVQGSTITSTYQFAATAQASSQKVILDMSSASEVSNVVGLNVIGSGTQGAAAYRASHEGQSGIAMISYQLNTEWPAFSFKTPNDLSTYAGYNYIGIKIYVSEDIPMRYFRLANDSDQVVSAIDPAVIVGGWKEYVFPATPFYNLWSQANADDFSKARIWMECPSSTGEIYIDSIRLFNHSRPEPDADEVEKCTTSDCLATMSMRYSTNKEYVMDGPSGATHGSVKFTIQQNNSDNWPILWLTPRQAVNAYESYDNVVLVMKFDTTNLGYVDLVFWEGNTQRRKVKANEWVEITVSMSEFISNYDLLGDTTVYQGWFWTTNNGGTSIQSISLYEIYVTAQTPTSGGVLLEMNSSSISKLSSKNTYETTWATGNEGSIEKPSDVDGMAIIEKIDGTESPEYFEVALKPDCSYSEFKDYDIIRVRLCSSVDATLYYRNHKLTTLTANVWKTVDISKYVYAVTEHAGCVYTNDRYFYEELPTAFFMLKVASGSTFKCAIAEMSLVKETVDPTLNNNYTHLSTDTVTVNSGTVTTGTFFGKQAVKMAYGSSTWMNIYVKPGKTYNEIKASNGIRVEMYIEGANAVELYNQAKLYGSTTNDFVSFGTHAAGEWFTFDISRDRILDMWGAFKTYDSPWALIIDRGIAFTAMYIASITVL